MDHAVRGLLLHSKGIWHLLSLGNSYCTAQRLGRVDGILPQSQLLRGWHLMREHFILPVISFGLHREELLKFSVHDFYSFVSPVDNSLEQLPGLNDGNLCLLLLSFSQALEGCVEVVLDFGVYLRYDIFLFFSDNLDEFKALLALK